MSAQASICRNQLRRSEGASRSRIDIGQDIPCDTSVIPAGEETTAPFVRLGIEGCLVWVRAKVKRSGVVQ